MNVVLLEHNFFFPYCFVILVVQCPVTCGVHAQQHRTVACVSRDASRNVSESDCDYTQRPAVVKSCRLAACPKGEPPLGTWNIGTWGEVSFFLNENTYFFSARPLAMVAGRDAS